MKSIVRAALAAGAAWALIGAWTTARAAADPNISTTVEPIPAQVTLRRSTQTAVPLNTLAAYRVTITNATTNTLNRVFLNGTAVNVGGTDLVAFHSAEGATCSTGATANVITCSPTVTSLAAGGSAQFIVAFLAPTTGQRIDFSWLAGGFEGKGKGQGCCSQQGTAQTGLVDPTTDPSYRSLMRSYVALAGGSFYTGDLAVPTSGSNNTPDDPFATLISVPSAASSSKAQITEVPETCNGLPLCFRSTISITSLADGTPTPFPASPYLKVVLRLDASRVIGRGIGNVLLFYTGGPYVEQLVPDCASGPVPTGTGLPCIAARKVYNVSDGPALNGDFEWTLINTENGSIKIFP